MSDLKDMKNLVRNSRQAYEICQARRHSAEVGLSLMELQLSSMQSWVDTLKGWEDQAKIGLDAAKSELKKMESKCKEEDRDKEYWGPG